MEDFLRAIIEGLLNGGIYALIALGVVVVYKASSVFNIAYGEIMMLLAYIIVSLVATLSSIWIALAITVLAAILIGLAIDRLLMRPIMNQPMMVSFMVCLLLGIFVKGATVLWWKGLPRTMPEIIPSGRLAIGGITVSTTLVWGFFIAVAMFLLLALFFRYTRIGLGMRCVSEDTHVSQSLGINVKGIFALAWVIGCVTAIVSAVITGSVFFVDNTVGMFVIIRALPILLLGGLESIPGALIAALIVGLTESMTSVYIDPHIRGFRELVPFILMVIILMIRPHGLFGKRRIERI